MARRGFQWVSGLSGLGVAAMALLGPAGCGTIRPEDAGKGGSSSTSQSITSPDPTYPAGPYGYDVNSVIADFRLQGYRDSNANGSLLDEQMADLWLSDYRAKGYKAIVLSASAEWCPPCNDEQKDLVAMFQTYNKDTPTVAFIEALVQSQDGSPADSGTLNRWARKHTIPFDLVADPTELLSPYYNINAFPMGMVIKVDTMQIYWEFNGEAPDQMKAQVDAILNGF